MPPDADTPVADPSTTTEDPSAAQATHAAAPSPPTLRDAFRADPDGAALKAPGTRGTNPPSTEGEAPPEASAASEDAASKSGGARERQQGSRRGAAEALAGRDEEIERLLAERQAEQARADQAAAALASVTERHQRAQKSVLDRIGDDAEFERLQTARLHQQTLSYEENERLDTMLSARGEAATYWSLAEQGHKAHVARGLADRCEKYGLDRKVAFDADLGGLVDHAVEVTEKRVRAESHERIASLEAELKGLRPRAAAARVTPPTSGGASAGGRDGVPAEGSSPLEFFRAGERQRQEQAAVRGSRR